MRRLSSLRPRTAAELAAAKPRASKHGPFSFVQAHARSAPQERKLSSRVIARHGLGLVLGCVLAVGFADMGCTPDTRRSGSDSGPRTPTDSGIVLRDADDSPPPTPRDAGIVIRDSGPPPPPFDAGPPPPTPGACRLDAFTQLPAACLPRCSAATDSAVRACEDSDCFNAALDADTTPTISLGLPDGTTTPIDCGDCISIQAQSCWAEFCPSEFQSLLDCQDAGGTCTFESDSLDTCRAGASVVDCENTRLNLCF